MAEQSKNTGKSRHSASGVLGAYIRHLGALKGFVARFLGNQHDIEDVVQEAFLRAYGAEQGKQIEQPKSFLFKIAKNVALNQLRQKTRKPTTFLDDFDTSEVVTDHETLEDQMMAQQRLGIHCAAVASLPPKCRKVYLMRKVYAMTYKEIAEELDITVSTVETHLEKGFSRCDAYVEKRMNETKKPCVRATQQRGNRS